MVVLMVSFTFISFMELALMKVYYAVNQMSTCSSWLTAQNGAFLRFGGGLLTHPAE
jgi:hypothetical protein